MNGVVVKAERPLDFASEADAVIFGSGVKSVEIANDVALLARIRLDPKRQLVASQCSGALLLAKLGLLEGLPACTDLSTKKWVVEAGVSVIDRPFHVEGNVATAGGCLALSISPAASFCVSGRGKISRPLSNASLLSASRSSTSPGQ